MRISLFIRASSPRVPAGSVRERPRPSRAGRMDAPPGTGSVLGSRFIGKGGSCCAGKQRKQSVLGQFCSWIWAGASQRDLSAPGTTGRAIAAPGDVSPPSALQLRGRGRGRLKGVFNESVHFQEIFLLFFLLLLLLFFQWKIKVLVNFLRTFVHSLLPAKLCFVLVTEPLSPSAGRGPGPGTGTVSWQCHQPCPLPSRLRQSPSSNQLPFGGLFPSPPCA